VILPAFIKLNDSTVFGDKGQPFQTHHALHGKHFGGSFTATEDQGDTMFTQAGVSLSRGLPVAGVAILECAVNIGKHQQWVVKCWHGLLLAVR
jgi:hypothetical protein